MYFNTKTIHAGLSPDPLTGAVMTPIYQTSTYAQSSPGKHKGYEYSRTHNPTRTALQDNLAALENGQFGLCFATGMAAIDAVIKLLKPGEEVIAANDLYGGSYRIFTKIFEPFGIKFHFVNMNDTSAAAALINANTRMIWLESPTNPLLHIIDIAAFGDLAAAHNLLLAVDNTFATPYLQTPLDLGAHIVMHSLTKYMAGHSDTVMGALIVRDQELAARLAFIQNACGATPGPQDCFLVLRGLKTLHIRMQRHTENATHIANYLNAHQAVGRVYYPGLAAHSGHILASKQMRGYGGMVSFELKNDDINQAIRLMESLKVFTLGESLGGVESLCTHPATMTHASIPAELRLANGLKDSLMRLSVGIEDVRDLEQDLQQAIEIALKS